MPKILPLKCDIVSVLTDFGKVAKILSQCQSREVGLKLMGTCAEFEGNVCHDKLSSIEDEFTIHKRNLTNNIRRVLLRATVIPSIYMRACSWISCFQTFQWMISLDFFHASVNLLFTETGPGDACACLELKKFDCKKLLTTLPL